MVDPFSVAREYFRPVRRDQSGGRFSGPEAGAREDAGAGSLTSDEVEGAGCGAAACLLPPPRDWM